MEKITVRIKECEKLYEVLIGSSISTSIAEFIRKKQIEGGEGKDRRQAAGKEIW